MILFNFNRWMHINFWWEGDHSLIEELFIMEEEMVTNRQINMEKKINLHTLDEELEKVGKVILSRILAYAKKLEKQEP